MGNLAELLGYEPDDHNRALVEAALDLKACGCTIALTRKKWDVRGMRVLKGEEPLQTAERLSYKLFCACQIEEIPEAMEMLRSGYRILDRTQQKEERRSRQDRRPMNWRDKNWQVPKRQ